MRVVVTGASGNVGTAVVEALGGHRDIDSIVGICRRSHRWTPAKTEWVPADVAQTNLVPVLDGADAVVHLAWLFQPTRHPQVTWRNNVVGTARLLDAVAATDVPTLVVASSVGAYSPRAGLDLVDESWPTHGVPETAYSREKAYVERLLDVHEARHPSRRVVRMRPAFIFSRRASIQQRRLFLGPLVPHPVLAGRRLPVIPMPRDLRLQALHADDVANAYLAAVLKPVSGAFNLTATPTLDPPAIAGLLEGRWVPTPRGVMRTMLTAAYRSRAVPAAPELFDLLMQVPMMDPTRARDELGWSPSHTSADAVRAFLEGLGSDDALPTPPLQPSSSGPARVHELRTGVGSRA